MSNYNSLKTTIDANIKQNGRQEITGQILNSVLNQMVTDLGAGYQYMDVATPDTNPGTPDAKVFYIANGKGTYNNFGGLEVTEDDVVVLYWDSSWHKVATGIASQEKLTELESKVTIFGLATKTTENSQEFFDITDLNGKPINNISLNKGTHLVVTMMDAATTGACAIRIGDSSRDIMFNKTFPSVYNSWKSGDIVDIFIDDHIIESAPDAIRANVTLHSKTILQGFGNNSEYGISQKVIGTTIGFFDVHSTQEKKESFVSRADARNAVPLEIRKQGLSICYYISDTGVVWQNAQFVVERFIGSSYIDAWSNNNYWEDVNNGLSDYSYLGDITDEIEPLGVNYVCKFNPNVEYGTSSNRLAAKDRTRCYYTATVRRGLTTFTNIGVNYTCKYDTEYVIIRKNPLYWYVEPYLKGLGEELTNIKIESETKVDKNINPLKNCFRLSDTIVGKHIIDFASSNPGIVDEENARIAIIPLYGWGDGNYCNISGFGKRKYDTSIIFLDENKTPVNNGGIYRIDENGSFKSIGLGSMKMFGLCYIAIELYRGADFNNRNSENGYVWNDQEEKQGYPNWLNDVCINFSIDDSTILPEKEDGCCDFYRYDKTYCFAKASEEFATHVIKRGTSNKMFNFAFATDSHIDANYASKQNVIDMVDFINQSNINPFIDCIIHGGDIATPSYIMSYDNSIKIFIEYYNIVSKCRADYIQVIGNHDKHREHNVKIEEVFSDSTIVGMLKQYTKHISDNIYETIDYTDKKIRIIKLDAFDYPNEANSEGKVKYPLDLYDPYISQSQMEWFINQLASTPEGYSIIVVSHSYMQSILTNYITMMMKALKDKSTGTMTVTYDYSYEMPTNEYSVNYDFTTANTCYPAICLCGHSHADGYDKKNGIHVLNTGCQALINAIKPWRIQNTPTQNLFNLMTIDSVDHRIYITRYGILEDPDFIKDVEPSFDTIGFLTY